jgi:LmbE family N-acetylglucosaminyl deacetylase
VKFSGLALMAFFAHPDHEAVGTGSALAKYAAEGCDVYLATATRGEGAVWGRMVVVLREGRNLVG